MTAAERLWAQFRFGPKTAVVVHDPSNMFYLTEGYNGEGLVFLTANKQVIITDFQYTEQAERQAPDFLVEMTDKDRKQARVLCDLLQAEGITELRLETNYLPVDDYQALKAGLPEEVSILSWTRLPRSFARSRPRRRCWPFARPAISPPRPSAPSCRKFAKG